jgi:glutamyl-Q tRNA(Asp) synthetase
VTPFNPPLSMTQPVFRFAPSPNGRLHLGHALSALVNFERAQAAGGRFLLRFEDIDTERCRPEYEAAIREDLAWLGIGFEEPVRRQSEHFDAYRAALAVLGARGLLVRSFATRREIATAAAQAAAAGAPWPLDPDGVPLFPGDAALLTAAEMDRRAATGEPAATRLAMQAAIAAAGAIAATPLAWTETGEGPGGETGTVAARPEAFGDVVLARKETPTSYHLSVVVDDALQGVTHVVRGADLFAATAVHRLLQVLLGLPAPVYHHHRLVLGPDGRKLAKSNRDTSLADLRAGGATPADIRRMVGLEL